MDLRKYDIPVPRYTSYPTVPFWNTKEFTLEGYRETLQSAFWSSKKEVSIYIHLPFCESLCTYCACNTRITKNHQVEDPYIEHLLLEWDEYLKLLPNTPSIREVHLGGGTPTFFSPKNLERLIDGILKKSSVSSDLQMSFEGHPGNTTGEHLLRLKQLGFDRLSLGIQDFDPDVQQLINRKQTVEQVRDVTSLARDLGYTSINYDMVYGLPGQTTKSLKKTLKSVNLLGPDRIAYYSYAHVPTMRPAQRVYEQQLPSGEEKFQFMLLGKDLMTKHGYQEVGLDHFVRPGDELLTAQEKGELHRNFMGYTPFTSKLLIGLGVSAISDSWSGFAQNAKDIPSYYDSLDKGSLPIIKGHLHSQEDIFRREQILNLMCNFQTSWKDDELLRYGLSSNYELLEQLEKEGLIALGPDTLQVNPSGKEIIRVICSALDAGLSTKGENPQFSKSI